MKKKLNQIRMFLLIVSSISYIGATIISILGSRDHINFNLEITFCFVFALVLFILSIIYPVIYKAELMIKKMEEEEDKKNK